MGEGHLVTQQTSSNLIESKLSLKLKLKDSGAKDNNYADMLS